MSQIVYEGVDYLSETSLESMNQKDFMLNVEEEVWKFLEAVRKDHVVREL